jgi:hypothetical protein
MEEIKKFVDKINKHFPENWEKFLTRGEEDGKYYYLLCAKNPEEDCIYLLSAEYNGPILDWDDIWDDINE